MTPGEYEVKQMELEVATCKSRVNEAKVTLEYQEMEARSKCESKIAFYRGEYEREVLDLRKAELALAKAKDNQEKGFE